MMFVDKLKFCQGGYQDLGSSTPYRQRKSKVVEFISLKFDDDVSFFQDLLTCLILKAV